MLMSMRSSLLLLLFALTWTADSEDITLHQIRSQSIGGVTCVLIDGKGKQENKDVAEVMESVREMVVGYAFEIIRYQSTATSASYSLDEPTLRSDVAVHPHILTFVNGKRESLLYLTPEKRSTSYLVEYFRTLLYNSVTYESLSSLSAVHRFLRNPRAVRILRVVKDDDEEEEGVGVSECSRTVSSLDVSWWDELCVHFLANASVQVAATSSSFSPVPMKASHLLLFQTGFGSELTEYIGELTVAAILSWMDTLMESQRVFYVNLHNSFSFYNTSSTPSLTIFDPRVVDNDDVTHRYSVLLEEVKQRMESPTKWKFAISSFNTMKFALPGLWEDAAFRDFQNHFRIASESERNAMMKVYEQTSSFPPPQSVVVGVWGADGYLYFSFDSHASPDSIMSAIQSAVRGEGLYVARVLMKSRLGLHWPAESACKLANTHDLRDILRHPTTDLLLFCGPKTDGILDAISIESSKLFRKFDTLSLIRFDPIENTLPRDVELEWAKYPFSSVFLITRERQIFHYLPQNVSVTTLALLDFIQHNKADGTYSPKCADITKAQLSEYAQNRNLERLILLYNSTDTPKSLSILSEWAKVSSSLHPTLIPCFQYDISSDTLPHDYHSRVYPSIFLASQLYEKPQLFIGNKKKDDIVYWTSRKAMEMYPMPDELFPRILRKFKD